MRIRKLEKEEQRQWDALVCVAAQAGPYHRSAWLEAVHDAYGHETFAIGAWRGSQLVAVLPLSVHRVPFRQPVLTSLPFCDYGGPVVMPHEEERTGRLSGGKVSPVCVEALALYPETANLPERGKASQEGERESVSDALHTARAAQALLDHVRHMARARFMGLDMRLVEGDWANHETTADDADPKSGPDSETGSETGSGTESRHAAQKGAMRGMPWLTSGDVSKVLMRLSLPYAEGAGTGAEDTGKTGAARRQVARLEGDELLAGSAAQALWCSFRAKLRSQIQRPVKAGCMVENSDDRLTSEELLDDFYDVYTRNMRDLGSPPHARRWFGAILRHFAEDAMVFIVREPEGHAVAAAILLMHGSMATVPWASSLREWNKVSPNMLLYWAMLRHAANTGCTLFDFGRSTPGEGTYRFKSQWGAQPVPLRWLRWDGRNEAGDSAVPGREVSGSAQSARIKGPGGPESPERLGDHGQASAPAVAHPGGHVEISTADEDRNHAQPSRFRTMAASCWRLLPVPVSTAVGSALRGYISL